jgi:hypothetical protein
LNNVYSDCVHGKERAVAKIVVVAHIIMEERRADVKVRWKWPMSTEEDKKSKL